MNKKLRPISEKSSSQTLDISAKAELTARAALEFQLVGINVADVGLKGGIGAQANTKIYSFDKSTDALLEVCGVQGAVTSFGSPVEANKEITIGDCALKIDHDEVRTVKTCLEFKVYPIFTIFGCSKSSVVGKLLGSIELELLGEKTPIWLLHCESDENGCGIVSECTITANENYGITTGDNLTVNHDQYAVDVSEDANTGLAVVTLPKNSTIKDVSITCDDPEVLEVENLLNKKTWEFPSAKPKLKVTASPFTALFKKDSGEGVDIERSIEFGTWFYQDASSGSKPQFALTGKKNGRVNVTITANGESVTVPVTVGTGEEAVVSTGALIYSKGTFTLAPGETAQPEFEYIPEGKDASEIEFQSDDPAVAKVTKEGIIKAVGEGDTHITATLHGKDKDYTTTFTVHVRAS